MYPLNALRETHFTLWAPGGKISTAYLILATVQDGSPMKVTEEAPQKLEETSPGLWTREASNSFLKAGTTYYYWFEVTTDEKTIRITDPLATGVDWRIVAYPNDARYSPDEHYPAGLLRWDGTKLKVADPVREDIQMLSDTPYPTNLPTNRQLVIYELPTAWMRSAKVGARDAAIGTFRDVMALVDENVPGGLPEVDILRLNEAYLKDLGVNAIELLPPADSVYPRQWGYGTTNFNAPDHELGFSENYTHPAPNRDLAELVRKLHGAGIRIFADVVMAFAKNSPYRSISGARDNFFVFPWKMNENELKADMDVWNSRQGDQKKVRDGYGADLWRYARLVEGYDPLTGRVGRFSPARQFLSLVQERWMRDFHIDGFRLDSVENVYNWEFVEEFRDAGSRLHSEREGASEDTYLCVGEELSEPRELFYQKRLDGIWREEFKKYAHCCIMGWNHGNDNFYWTVRKCIYSPDDGYPSLTNAIIFLTSHDVEGPGNERIWQFLKYQNLNDAQIYRRVKLAFALLLTAVGIPMILAGDEFADQHDQFAETGHGDSKRSEISQSGGKQTDPVNFARLQEPARKDVLKYVSRLIKLRTSHPALAVERTSFHYDDHDGKKVMVWTRGDPNSEAGPVVVVGNFSGWKSRDGDSYNVPNWPRIPEGKVWKEAGMDRVARNAGSEPIYDWEAKVYYWADE